MLLAPSDCRFTVNVSSVTKTGGLAPPLCLFRPAPGSYTMPRRPQAALNARTAETAIIAIFLPPGFFSVLLSLSAFPFTADLLAMICSLAKWYETNYQGNTSQPMLQTEGKKQVISGFQDWGDSSA